MKEKKKERTSNLKKNNCTEFHNDDLLEDYDALEEEIAECNEDIDDFFKDDDINSKTAVQQFIKDIKNIPLMSKEEEYEVGMRAYSGDKEAKKQLVERNLRLGISIAGKWHTKNQKTDLADLIQEANIGLILAADKFDPNIGCKFSTYAAWWIRKTVRENSLTQNQTIKLPKHRTEEIIKLKTAYKILTNELMREPTVEELSTKTEIPVNDIHMLNNTQTTALNHETEDGEVIENNLYDAKTSDIEDDYIKKDMCEKAVSLLSILDEKSRFVIINRTGLGDGVPKTLSEISGMLGVTRERIRQIEAKALRMLRAESDDREMSSYLTEFRYL